LGRGGAYKISDVLLSESEKDIKGRKKVFPFPLYFLLETRVKVTSVSGISTTISISGENIGIELEP